MDKSKCAPGSLTDHPKRDSLKAKRLWTFITGWFMPGRIYPCVCENIGDNGRNGLKKTNFFINETVHLVCDMQRSKLSNAFRSVRNFSVTNEE